MQRGGALGRIDERFLPIQETIQHPRAPAEHRLRGDFSDDGLSENRTQGQERVLARDELASVANSPDRSLVPGSSLAELTSLLTAALRDPTWSPSTGALEVSDLVIDVRAFGSPDGGNCGGEATAFPVFPVRAYRSVLLLGPLWRADDPVGPCAGCLERRWLALRPPQEQKVLERAGNAIVMEPVRTPSPFVVEAAASVIGHLLQLVTTDPAGHGSYVHQLDLATLELTRWPLLAHSECEACTSLRPPGTSPFGGQLNSRQKRAISQYRLKGATECALPLDAYLNPVCGVLGASAVPVYDSPVSAPVGGFFQVRSKYDYHQAWWSGHGTTYNDSTFLGVLEGLERYAGQTKRNVPTEVFDSYDNLGEAALDPRPCGLYEEGFYRLHPAYKSFDTSRPTYWVPGYSFARQGPILVPEQLVYYLDHRAEHANFVQDCSNGCASGSCLEEALLFGLLELIERDAFLVAWYARRRLTQIDPSSCHSAETRFVVDRLDRMGYDVRLLDMRIDLSIPAVMGLAIRRDNGLGTLVFAAGASLDPEDAVRAALCEVACYVPGFDERVASQLTAARAMAGDYSMVRDQTDHQLLYGLPEMAPRADFLVEPSPAVTMDDLFAPWLAQRPATLDLRDDVRFCIEHVLALGFDVVAVNQTPPEQAVADLHTVRVLVPGFLPIDFGWDRQRAVGMPRLRTVLRQSGLRPTDLDPTDLHLHPHPFP